MPKNPAVMIKDLVEQEIIQLKETIRLLKVKEKLQSIQYHHLIQLTQTAYVKLDSKGIILESNEQALAMLGVKAVAVVQQQFISLLAAEGIAAFTNWYYLSCANRSPSSIEVKLADSEQIGKKLTLHTADFFEEDSVIIYMQEVNEKKQNQLNQDDKYRTVLEQSYEGVLIYNLKGNLIEFNDKAHNYLGYTREEFSKLKLTDLFFSEDIYEKPIAFHLLKEGKPLIDCRRLRRNDGSGIDMELNSKMLADGSILVFGRDITARKKHEAETQRLSKIVKNSRDEMFIVNPINFKFEYANEAALEILGYTSEQMYQLTPLDIKPLMKSADFETILAPLKAGEKDKIVFETLQKKKDQSIYPVEVHYQLIDLGSRKVYLNITRDITERRNAAIALETKEKYFRKLIEYSSSAVVLFDKAGNFIYQSPVVEKIMGYQLEEGVYSNALTFMHPDDVDKFAVNYEQLLQSPGKVYNGQYRFRHRDGHYVWLEGTVTNLLHFEPINAIIANYVDVTERKLAEEAVKRERSLLRTLIDNLPDPIYVKDTTGKKIIANREDQYFMGVADEEEIIGKTDLELYPGEVGVRGHENDLSVMKSGHAILNAEDQFVDAKGIHHWLVTSKIPLLNSAGDTIGLMGIGREITQRKLIENELLKSNERFEYVLQATFDAIWDWEIVKGELSWGDNFEKYFGYQSMDSQLNLQLRNTLVHPDDVERVNQTLQNFCNGTDHIWYDQYRFKKACGEYCYVADRGIIIRDEKGKALRMIGAMHDISEQKKDEENVRRLNTELAEKAVALSNSNKELEKFAYVASHDLQEPLRMVTGFLGLLEKTCKPVLDASAISYINFAIDGASRMKILITDLLEYSRVSSSGAEIGNSDMNIVLKEVIEIFRATIDEFGAKITVGNLPVLPGTRKIQLVQLMQNIIGNALKYHSELTPEINIEVIERESDWLFSVADNGIGIDPVFADKIFVIFQRLHTRDEFSGTGIGLSICKKIVEIHGGNIWVSPNNIKGCIFNFTIKKNECR